MILLQKQLLKKNNNIMNKILISFFFFFFFNLISFGQNKYNEIDNLLNSESMLDAKLAIEKLESSFKSENKTSDYWLRMSKANLNIFRYEDALTDMDKAINFDSKNANLYYEKGRLLNNLDKNEQALENFSKAIYLKPEPEFYFWKAICHQNLQQLADAEANYKKAIDGGLNSPEVHFNYAIILYQNNKFSESLKQNNKAIELNENYAKAYSFRALNHLMNLDIDAAYRDNEKASSLGQRNTVYIPEEIYKGSEIIKNEFLGGFLLANKNYKQGVAVFTKLINGNSNASAMYLNRGYCYFQINEYKKAESDYYKALELPNASVDLLYDNLSLLYFNEENYAKAIECSSKRIELNPQNHVPYIDRGLSYRKLKKYKEAEADFNKSLEIKPDFFRAFGYRAYLNLELGYFLKSYEDASKAIEINPTYDYAYLVLGQAKIELGKIDYCEDFYKAKKYGNPEADEAILKYCKN